MFTFVEFAKLLRGRLLGRWAVITVLAEPVGKFVADRIVDSRGSIDAPSLAWRGL
jgi:hypothetical protein